MVESKLNHLPQWAYELFRIESRGMTCWQTGMTMTMTHQYIRAQATLMGQWVSPTRQ